MKNTQSLLQQCAILIDTDINNHDDPIDKKTPQEDNYFHPDLSLKNI